MQMRVLLTNDDGIQAAGLQTLRRALLPLPGIELAVGYNRPIWINLLGRTDIGFIAKLTWAIVALIPFVPFVYVLTGNDLY